MISVRRVTSSGVLINWKLTALNVQLANWKDVRLVMNRAVVKQHERLLRQNKPETAMDNREARMQALKANDFAAYQAMLKATQGDAAALDDRCVKQFSVKETSL